MTQCKAKSKRTGQQCQQYAMHGKSVCYHHGGKSLAGASAPALRHGRYSKYLPVHLADKYQESLNDADLLALRDEIALIDSRVLEILSNGNMDDRQWSVVEQTLDLRRRMVETERKRLVDLQQMMTAEQAMTMLAVIVDTVKRHVNDRDILQAISADLAKLVSVPVRGTDQS
jgi:hypothetical protein